MKRKVLSIFLAFVLVAGLLPCTAFAAGTTEISMEKEYFARAGETVSVEIVMTGNDEGIGAINFTCAFDEAITCTKVTNGGMFSSMSAKTGNNPMKVVAYSDENVTGDGTIVTMEFTVAEDCEDGTYPLTLALESASRVADDGSSTESVTNITMTSGAIIVAKEQFSDEIAFEDDSFTYTYNGKSQTPEISGTLPEGTDVTYSYKDSDGNTLDGAPVDAGTYEVTATVTCSGYATKTLTATMTINPANLTVSGLTAQDKAYDGTTDATVTGGELVGVVEGDDVSPNFPRTGTFASANVGNNISVSIAAITLSGDDAANYEVTQPTLTANISKAAITVKADNLDKVQFEEDPLLTYEITAGALAGEDAFTGELSREVGEAPGTYAITQGTLALSNNYDLTFVPGTFTITAAKVTGLEITTPPTKTDYVEGQKFDPAGMVVTATYETGNSEPVTGYTCDPETLALDTTEVTISFGGQSDTVSVTVIPNALDTISVDTTKAKTSYKVGNTFSTEGLVVTANYTNGTSKAVTGYEVSTPDMTQLGNQTVTVTYTEGDKIATAEYTINVTSSSSGSSGGGSTGSSTGSTANTDNTDNPAVVEPEDKTPFTDISGHWAEEVIGEIYSQGIMSGVSATEFGPNLTLTRGMVVTILYGLEGKPEVTAKNEFTDVAEDQYYCKATTWAAENGIVTGMGEGIFAPNANITREQLATIMRQYAQFKGADVSETTSLDAYKDAGQVSAWAVENVEWAVANNIISGKGDGILDAQGTATRAECAQIIYNFIGE